MPEVEIEFHRNLRQGNGHAHGANAELMMKSAFQLDAGRLKATTSPPLRQSG
jgi:hypothetical protein